MGTPYSAKVKGFDMDIIFLVLALVLLLLWCNTLGVSHP